MSSNTKNLREFSAMILESGRITSELLAIAADRLDAQAAEIERLKDVALQADEALQNYERMGEVCPFEGQPMIYAETLVEIGELARAALSGETA